MKAILNMTVFQTNDDMAALGVVELDDDLRQELDEMMEGLSMTDIRNAVMRNMTASRIIGIACRQIRRIADRAIAAGELPDVAKAAMELDRFVADTRSPNLCQFMGVGVLLDGEKPYLCSALEREFAGYGIKTGYTFYKWVSDDCPAEFGGVLWV